MVVTECSFSTPFYTTEKGFYECFYIMLYNSSNVLLRSTAVDVSGEIYYANQLSFKIQSELNTAFNDIATNTNGIAILSNTVGSNMTFVNSHQNTATSHISLIDTNINNITGHGNTITTLLTDIADLQAGAGASWTTAEKTTIQADVSTLFTNDTNLFNSNTAYSNTFASIISDSNTQDVLITQIQSQ